MKLACAIAAALLLLPAAGWSQTPVAPDPERLALARQIFEAQGGVANMTAVLRGATANMTAGISQTPGADPNIQRATMTAANDAMVKLFPHLIDEMGKIYAADFDEAELRGILAFYQSPTGRTLVAKLPEIGAQTGTVMGRLMPPLQLAILESVCASTACPAATQDRLAKLRDSVPPEQRF